MVKSDLVAEGKFDEIEALTKEAMNKMLGFEVAHIGINAGSAEKGDAIMKLFTSLFGFSEKTGEKSNFSSDRIEIMKKADAPGTNGHLAIGTNYLDRAIAYLKAQGFAFDEDSKMFNDKGELRAIYLAEEIGGFGVHLVQK